MLKTKVPALALAAVALVIAGCRSNAGTGSLLGAGLGSALGAVIGHHNDHRGAGAAIGAGAGAILGYALGNEVDKEQRGTHYAGDPRYEPGYPRRRERVYYYDDPPPPPPRERVIYRERYIYEVAPQPCW